MALDFPSSPTNGQVYDNFYYDSAKGVWKSLSSGASPNYITNAVISATAPNATTIPLTVTGAASQSSALQSWKNSSGSTVSYVGPSGEIVSTNRVIGVTPNDLGSTGGLISRAPAGGSQTSAYLQFVNNANTAQWGAIEATSGSVMNLFANQVRIPNQPLFSVTKTGVWETVSPGVAVAFNSAQINVGNNYNTSNGRFTAPVAGKYLFFFNFYVDGNRQASFKKNGSDYIPTDTAIASSNATGVSISASYIFDLAAGDYIQVGARSGSISLYFYPGHSWFAGYMIG